MPIVGQGRPSPPVKCTQDWDGLSADEGGLARKIGMTFTNAALWRGRKANEMSV
jgi:hypothetical protein